MRPYELFVGLRYTRAKRRNHFISFISMASMIGIAIGVMALIVVLSVMNGFQKELRTRILGVASHVQISGFRGHAAATGSQVAQEARAHPEVVAAAPYVAAQGLLANQQSVQGALVRGIVPELEDQVADIGKHMKRGKLSDLRPGEFGIVLGQDLAHSVGVRVGEKVVLIAPQGQVTPAGILPRIKQFTVVGTFEVGMYRVRRRAGADASRGRAEAVPARGKRVGRAAQAATTCSKRRRWRASSRARCRAICTSPTGRAVTPTSSARCRSRRT